MGRSIKTLRSPFEEVVTEAYVHAAALQFVRKISGIRKPSKANELAFDNSVSQIAANSRELLDSLVVRPPATAN